MATLLLSSLDQVYSTTKLLKASELGLQWGATLFPKARQWGALIQRVRAFSEPFIVGSCAKSAYKWGSGLKKSLTSCSTSLKESAARYIGLSASLTEKMLKVGSWLSRMKWLPSCEHIVYELGLGATVAEGLAAGIDVGFLSQNPTGSWKELAKKSMDLAAAVLILAVMAETGLPVQEVILLLRTGSLGINLSDMLTEINMYLEKVFPAKTVKEVELSVPFDIV